jgi:hypothetical protein
VGDHDDFDWDAEMDEDDEAYPSGELRVEDMVDQHLEQELANFGKARLYVMLAQLILSTAEEITNDELAFLRHFALKIESHMTDETFAKLPFAFPEANISSWKITRARAEFLVAFKPMLHDCCINSCCCYAGPHATAVSCPYCQEPHYNAAGRPRKRFTYVPIIPRLTAYYRNKSFVELLSYRANFTHEPNIVKDVMDGQNYTRLCQEYVTIEEKRRPYKFFEDPRDIALGLSTDGFAPFRRRKKTCWPLLLYNYNLPPEIRFHLEYVLCLGVIPGPNKPKDFDSFLFPAVEELLQLAFGVRAFDVAQSELFALRAYLILVFGDIPAMSMVMCIKGHNGFCPCRMCHIKGLRIPNSCATTHYVPLDQSRHPDVQHNNAAIQKYDPSQLPLRTHADYIEQGRQVQFASNDTEFKKLSKQFGVKGVSILMHIPSIYYPSSFPYDFMHLVYEGVIKNLVMLWTGNFKGLDEGNGSYELSPKVWEAIGRATAASGSTIPLSFGARPPNVADDKSATTADTWSFWMLYLGPVLLSRRFKNEVYFKHFVELVTLIQTCLQFEITKDEILTLRAGFEKWVEKYERYVSHIYYSNTLKLWQGRLYYQYSPSRLSACPITIHALLHIADSIQDAGPVWTYWTFPTERYCGRLQSAIRSRRYPFANIDNYVVATAQLSQIKIRYGLEEELSLKPSRVDQPFGSFSHPACMPNLFCLFFLANWLFVLLRSKLYLATTKQAVHDHFRVTYI